VIDPNAYNRRPTLLSFTKYSKANEADNLETFQCSDRAIVLVGANKKTPV